ncbi:MAG: DUF2232 domain-containing protein [Proteobacteria bacterium]|nr:DUF2232 domain-containing protein [Pseudomonadota bacterium]
MSAGTLIAVAGGALSAVLYLTVVRGSPGAVMLAYFSPLPLFGVGLSLGTGFAGIAGAVATTGVGVTGGTLAAAVFAAMTALPVAWIVSCALRSRPAPMAPDRYPPGILVVWLTGIGAAGFLALALALAGTPGGIEGETQEFLTRLLTGLLPAVIETESVVEALAANFPALVVASWLFMMVLNGTLAQSLLVRFGRARRPTPDYSALALPGGLWPALVLAGSAMVVGSGWVEYLGRNLFVILAIPYFFQGLAVVHALARRTAQRTTILVMFYFVLLLFGWPGLLVAVLGVAEQWLGLRRARRATTLTRPEDE